MTSIELQYQHYMTWCLWTKSHFLCGHWTASNKGKPGDVWLKIGQPKSLCLTHFKICEINSRHQVSNHQIQFITQIQTYTVYTINKYVFIIFSAIPWFFSWSSFLFPPPSKHGPIHPPLRGGSWSLDERLEPENTWGKSSSKPISFRFHSLIFPGGEKPFKTH